MHITSYRIDSTICRRIINDISVVFLLCETHKHTISLYLTVNHSYCMGSSMRVYEVLYFIEKNSLCNQKASDKVKQLPKMNDRKFLKVSGNWKVAMNAGRMKGISEHRQWHRNVFCQILL